MENEERKTMSESEMTQGSFLFRRGNGARTVMRTSVCQSRTVCCVLVALCAAPLAGCDDVEGRDQIFEEDERVIYGADNRKDVFQSGDRRVRRLAKRSTVTMMKARHLNDDDPSDVEVDAETYGEYFGLCPGEPFADQVAAGFCSGTLIGDDLVLTAGHCVRKTCRKNDRFVFNYYNEQGGLNDISADDIFSCKEVLVRSNGALDYAIVQLDRSATPRFEPAPLIDHSNALAEGTKLAIIGNPSGLPTKIAKGGRVTDGEPETRNVFTATVDAFGGNSGSGVYVKRDDEFALAGILVAGAPDFDLQGDCLVENHCPAGGGDCDFDASDGEDLTYAFRARDALCEEVPDHGLCD